VYASGDDRELSSGGSTGRAEIPSSKGHPPSQSPRPAGLAGWVAGVRSLGLRMTGWSGCSLNVFGGVLFDITGYLPSASVVGISHRDVRLVGDGGTIDRDRERRKASERASNNNYSKREREREREYTYQRQTMPVSLLPSGEKR